LTQSAFFAYRNNVKVSFRRDCLEDFEVASTSKFVELLVIRQDQEVFRPSMSPRLTRRTQSSPVQQKHRFCLQSKANPRVRISNAPAGIRTRIMSCHLSAAMLPRAAGSLRTMCLLTHAALGWKAQVLPFSDPACGFPQALFEKGL